MPNQITWATVAFVLGSALLATLSTLAAVWLTHHFQLTTKKTELDAQAKLKARELLFNSYQQRLERLRKNAYETAEGMGKFIAMIKTMEDDDEKQDIMKTVRMLSVSVTDSVNELESELIQAGLFEKRKKQMSLIRERAESDWQALTGEELEVALFAVWRVGGLVSSLEHELLEKKGEDLFREYLVGANGKGK